tara:strand:- start:869 stop:1480 length:612 start_codon:yes stop_codon:yes gene_type:complete
MISKKNIFYRVLVVHFLIIIIFLLISFFKGCIKTKASAEIITYIDFKNEFEETDRISNKKDLASSKAPTPTSKWQPTSVNDIIKGKRIEKNTSNNDALKEVLDKIKKTSKIPNSTSAYLAKVKNLIYSNWIPPNVVSSNLQPATLRLFINSRGQIVKRIIVTSSNVKSYDESIIKAIVLLGSLPPPPSDYPHDFIEITFYKGD